MMVTPSSAVSIVILALCCSSSFRVVSAFGGTATVKTAVRVGTATCHHRYEVSRGGSSGRRMSSDDDDDPASVSTATGPPVTVAPPPPPRMNGRQYMAAVGTSPRRIFTSFASAGAIALAADFLGVTQRLLTALPEDAVESTGLDTYYPRDGMKRYSADEYGYSFVYPKQWVGDTSLELAKAQRRAKSLDYNMGGGSSRGQAPNTLPDAAFGPPGKLNARGTSESDTNVSVIATPLPASFVDMRTNFGTPQSAAEFLLRVSLAPEGSGRVATLLDACEETDRGGPVYRFEYLVDRGTKGVPLRAVSTIAVNRNTKPVLGSNTGGSGGSTLITMTVVAPQQDWENNANYAAQLRRVATTFKLTR